MLKVSNDDMYFNTKKNIYGTGSYGIVYDNNDGTLTKILRHSIVKPEAILRIKDLNLENFYKIYEVYCEKYDNISYLKGYKMNKIERDNYDILTSNKDFLITNIRLLIDSLTILSKNHIIVNDLHEDNMIVNKDGITIIDCDSYKINNEYAPHDILNYNINELHKSTYLLLKESINNKYRFSHDKKRQLKNLFFDHSFFEIFSELDSYNSIDEYIKRK